MSQGHLRIGLTWIVILAVALVPAAGCGGGSDSSTVRSTQVNKTTHRRRHVRPCRYRDRYGVHYTGYGDLGYRLPGRILGIPGGYLAPGEMGEEGNMWWASDCHTFTWVAAGSDGTHQADGLLAINRIRDPSHPHSTGKEIRVPDAGKLEITRAPLGPSVETWAQKRGNINFKGEHGIIGTLHLKDDTVVAGVRKDLVRVPDLMDKPLPAAKADLSDHDLRWKIVGQSPAGFGGKSPPLILGTKPPSGDRVHTGTTVLLYLKEGKQG